jgi:polar amino acid transport system substrate-binding protein
MKSIAAALIAAGLLTAGCAPADQDPGLQPAKEPKAADACAKGQLELLKDGRLTIATSPQVYEPWMVGNDPTNGKGFESAVAYAVADELGFSRGEVDWVQIPFNKSYQPGAKDFDFDINQISITPARAEVVDFSTGYYNAAQAIIALKDSPFADASSLADLKGAKLGAQVGTTSLQAIQNGIDPEQQPLVYTDTNNAKSALLNDQIDGIVVDLPTAFYIVDQQIPAGTIVGQFQPTNGSREQFGLLFEKGNPLVDCVNRALRALESSGELADIEQRWLSQVVDVPVLR